MSSTDHRGSEPASAGEDAPPAGATTPLADELGPLQRIAFRFTFAYSIIYLFPFPIGSLPGTQSLAMKYGDLLNAITPWIGTRLLGFEQVPIQPTGSGDTASSYAQHALFATLAAVAAAVWSALARGRRSAREQALQAWLRVYMRYALAAVMLGYGFVKVFKSQFPFPSPERLMTPLGAASPMGLLWRFMGYSTPYTMFTGFAEVLGGVLLFFRRTTTLGALVVAAVMANVVMLNFSYDVPVKLFSLHLFLLAVLLLLPDLRRLAAVLVLNRPAPAADLGRPAIPPRLKRPYILVKALLVASLVGATGYQGWSGYYQWGDGAPRHALHGAYEVDTFTRNGDVVPPSLTEASRWRRVAVGGQMWTAFRMDDSTQRYGMELEEATGKLTLKNGEVKHVLTLTRPDPEHLVVEGTLGEDHLSVRLKRIDTSKLELVKRGFHWVNELPHHR